MADTTPAPAGYKYDANGNLVPDTSASAPGADSTAATPVSAIPTTDPNAQNQSVGLTPAALSGAAASTPNTTASTLQSDTDVLAQAQSDVLNQPTTSALGDTLTQQAQNFAANPQGDYDPNKIKTAQMDAAQNQWAKQFENLRQTYGNTSGSGLTQQTMLQNALQHNTDMSTLSSQIDTDNYNKYIDSMTKALAAGQSVDKQNADLFTQSLGNLNTVRGMAEGERDQTVANTQQMDVLNTTFGEDMAKMVAANDFTGAQDQLNRDLQTSMQANDLAATASNVQKQLDLDQWKQENGEEFTAAQNDMDRTLQTSLKTMDIQSQTDLMNLKAKIDAGTLVTEQDFEASQNDINNKLKVAMQGTDIQAQQDLTTLKGQIDAQAQSAQNAFTAAQTTATQSWQSNQTISQDQFTAAQNYLQQQNQLAMQSNDEDTQKYLATQSASLQLQMQTQSMDQQTKMAYLNNQLAEATANNDVGRQEQIIGFQATQNMSAMIEQQGYDAAQKDLDRQQQLAVQNNDIAAQAALQTTQLTFQAKENAATNALEQARNDMQGQQIAMQGQQMTFDQIEQGVQNGQIDPSAAVAAIQSQATSEGITIQTPDPDAAAKAAVQQLNDQKAVFLASHPEYADSETTYTDPNGQTVTVDQVASVLGGSFSDTQLADAGYKKVTTSTLNASGMSAFNDFYNSTVYGENGTADAAAKIIASPSSFQGASSADNSNHAAYATLFSNAADASTITSSYTWDSKSLTRTFVNQPSSGSFFKSGNNLYMVTSQTGSENVGGKNTQYIVVQNVDKGTTTKIYCNNPLQGQLPDN